MFVRKKQNASGSLSIQIISNRGKYKVIRTVGCAKTKREEELLILLAKSVSWSEFREIRQLRYILPKSKQVKKNLQTTEL